MTKIEDPSLASALLQKVNDFNVKTAVQAPVYVLAFAALNKAGAICACIYAWIYIFRGRIPEDV